MGGGGGAGQELCYVMLFVYRNKYRLLHFLLVWFWGRLRRLLWRSQACLG